jgi:hypothetical protein
VAARILPIFSMTGLLFSAWVLVLCIIILWRHLRAAAWHVLS